MKAKEKLAKLSKVWTEMHGLPNLPQLPNPTPAAHVSANIAISNPDSQPTAQQDAVTIEQVEQVFVKSLANALTGRQLTPSPPAISTNPNVSPSTEDFRQLQSQISEWRLNHEQEILRQKLELDLLKTTRARKQPMADARVNDAQGQQKFDDSQERRRFEDTQDQFRFRDAQDRHQYFEAHEHQHFLKPKNNRLKMPETCNV